MTPLDAMRLVKSGAALSTAQRQEICAILYNLSMDIDKLNREITELRRGEGNAE